MTATIADALGLAAKGRVQQGKDADLLIFGDELTQYKNLEAEELG